MANRSPNFASQPAPGETARQGRLLGLPLGELGWFQSLLMGTAAGFAAFFLTCFLSIVAIMVLNEAGHRSIDYAVSYRDVAFPAGLAVLVLAYAYLGQLWLRRKLRHG